MPNLKRRLSRLEEATRRDYLRQLQSEGIDVEIPQEWQENSRALDIVLGESVVFESLTGGVYYAILVRLVAVLSRLLLTEWGLSTDYDAQIVPESFSERDPLWKLGSQVYQQREVLNSRIEKNLVVSHGEIAEGWLLASGITPIPAQYSNFAAVPFRLSFWDQFGDEIAVQRGNFSVLRKVQRDSTGMRKGTGLYGLDATGKPRELSIEEDARRRYLELLAREKLAKQQRVQR